MPIKSQKNNSWTLVIEPHSAWFDLPLRELWAQRELIFLFVRRDFLIQYKQTILGPLWHLIQPLLMAIVFTVVFGKIAKIPTDGTPPFLFYMSGIVLWNFMSGIVLSSSNSLIGSAMLSRKIYFPRLSIPVAGAISRLMSFATQFLLLICFLIYFSMNGADVSPQMSLLCLPIIILLVCALGLGVGLIVAAVTTRYRDLTVLLGFGIQLWMYASPIVYPLSVVPEKFAIWAAINPMTSLIELFRFSVLGSGTVDLSLLATSTLTILVLLVLGLVLFNRAQRNFVDSV